MTKQTVNIHGKDYETVASRIQRFWEEAKANRIITELVSNDNEYVVMVAKIYKDDVLVATGHAQEKYGATNINQTSALENCETSAIGRALATFGMAGTEFASADEVGNAISQQASGESYTPNKPASPKQKNFILKLYVEQGGEASMITDYLEKEGYDVDKLTSKQASEIIEKLQGAM